MRALATISAAVAASFACAGLEQRVLWSVNGHTLFTKVQDIAFSADGTEVLSAGEDRSIRVWGLQDGSLRRQVTGLDSAVGAARLSPDGQLFATCSFVHEGNEQSDRTVRVWRFSDLAPVAVVGGHPRGMMNVAWSPDGAWLATVDIAGTVRLVRTADWEVVAAQGTGTWSLMDVEFLPDGTLATLDFAGVFRRHALPSLAVLWGHDSTLHSVFSSMTVWRGQVATQASFDRVAWWDLASGTIGYSPSQLTQVYAAKPTPKLPLVALAGIGGTKEIEFWDVVRRQRVAMFDTDIVGFDAPYGMAFDPRSNRFAYGTFRGRVVLATWLQPDLAGPGG